MYIALQESNLRGIPTEISTHYYRKAKGRLVAKSNIEEGILSNITKETKVVLKTDISDSLNEDIVLASTHVTWMVSPKPIKNKHQ